MQIIVVLFLLLTVKAYALTAVNPTVPTTWSNRQGLSLTPITTGVWAAERPFIWNNIDVGGRSVVARMKDGNLLVHSPIEWTESLGNCLKSLGGEVKYVISPNYEHLKYAKQWSEKYPFAYMIACPGLPEKLPDINWNIELGHETPIEISNSNDSVFFDCELNPFTGKPFFNEVAFYHKQSKTFFTADLFWNYPASSKPNYWDSNLSTDTNKQHLCSKIPSPVLATGELPEVKVPFGTKLWKFGMDKVYHPFYNRLMVGKKGDRHTKYMEYVDKLLSWDVELIVPCHGDVIKGSELCKKVLTKHFL